MEGRVDDAKKLFASLETKGCEGNVVSYCVMINGYCEKRKIDDAVRLYKRMIQKGVKPDIVTMNTLLLGLFLVVRVKAARNHYDEMHIHNLLPQSRYVFYTIGRVLQE